MARGWIIKENTWNGATVRYRIGAYSTKYRSITSEMPAFWYIEEGIKAMSRWMGSRPDCFSIRRAGEDAVHSKP